MKLPYISISIVIICFLAFTALSASAGPKPIIPAPGYNHDRFNTQPKDIIRKFRAFTTSFDSEDDNDNFGGGDVWGIPEWVAYEIKRFDGDCIPTRKERPTWFSDEELISLNVAPKNESYSYSRSFRNKHPNWFIRGQLCMKMVAERLGNDAAHNTHTLLNTVPQRDEFNGGIWLDLEYLTAAWAQRYGSVWVITGPIIINRLPSSYIGESDKGEFAVAIPDALFKIVVKDSEKPNVPDVLAFIYPQVGPGYTEKEYFHEKFLTSVNVIEELTDLDFLTDLPSSIEKSIEKLVAENLWVAEEEDFIEACGKSRNWFCIYAKY